jgi:hypothetical protein
MGNRDLLAVVAELAPPHPPSGPARPPTAQSDGKQLASALPIRRRWLAFALITLLSMLLTYGWVAQLAWFAGPGPRAWLNTGGMRVALVLCLYLASIQHFLPQLRRLFIVWANRDPFPTSYIPYPWATFRMLGVVLGIILLFLLHRTPLLSGPWETGHASGQWAFPGAKFFVYLGPLLFTNWFVPESIARWRGAGLFYPTHAVLWLQRVITTVLLMGVSTLLALAIAHLMSP